MADRPTTIVDIARLASVSTATVSRVLNGKPSVDPELAKRVHQVVAEANYVPNTAGRTLRRSRSDLWALIVPDVMNPFFTSIMASFESAALESGHVVVLCNTKESPEYEAAYVDQMLAQQVAGVVIATTAAPQGSVGRLMAAGIPVILFDRRVRSFEGDVVIVDNDLVGQLAAEHMLEQGIEKPHVITGPKKISSTVDRERGFLRTFEDAGLPVSSDNVHRVGLLGDTPMDEVLTGLADLDGVFATNGPLTAATFRLLQDRGWQMPDQVALVGVDDDHWTRMVSPQVTVVSQPVRELGRWAARLLEARGRDASIDPARIVLEPTLVPRASSLRQPQG